MTLTHAILGCRNLSRVFTSTKPWHRDYVVCLDCGREFEYSLERMEIVREIQRLEVSMKTKPFRDKRGRFAKRPAKFTLAAPKAVEVQKHAGRSVVTAVDPVKRAITVDTHWLKPGDLIAKVGYDPSELPLAPYPQASDLVFNNLSRTDRPGINEPSIWRRIWNFVARRRA